MLSITISVSVGFFYCLSACMRRKPHVVVKNKGGDLTDVNNYRAIAVSNADTKILERIILSCYLLYIVCFLLFCMCMDPLWSEVNK